MVPFPSSPTTAPWRSSPAGGLTPETVADAIRAVRPRPGDLSDRPLGCVLELRRDRDTRPSTWERALADGGLVQGGVRFLFRDELGLRIPAWRVLREMDGLSGLVKVWRVRRPHVFRLGPVPGIRSRWGGSWYRHPRTTAEIRAGAAWAEEAREIEAEFGIRPKGRVRDVPVAWDDIGRSRGWRVKSWKEYRSTQHKEAGG